MAYVNDNNEKSSVESQIVIKAAHHVVSDIYILVKSPTEKSPNIGLPILLL